MTWFCIHKYKLVAVDNKSYWENNYGGKDHNFIHFIQCEKCTKKKIRVAEKISLEHRYVKLAKLNWESEGILTRAAILTDDYKKDRPVPQMNESAQSPIVKKI